MWSDNETPVDLLGISHLAAAVKQIIRSPHLLPTTVGLFGDWGSGKSSLACILQKELDEDKKVLCVTFNGWQQQDFEDAKLGLMGTLLDALVENRNAWDKAKDIVAKLAGRIDRMKAAEILMRVAAPVAAALAAGGGGAPPALALAATQGVAGVKAEDLKGLIKEKGDDQEPLRKSAREFRKDFGELLDKTGVETLVVFIDDLDRCLPDTIIDTLEALRLFLYTPRTAFIICADPQIVRAAVRHRYPQSAESPNLPGEYLEKLVQFPITIPPLAPADVSRYMTLLFGALHIGDGFGEALKKLPANRSELEALPPRRLAETLQSPLSTDFSEGVAIVEQVGDELAVHLNGNPRQVKRFLNTLMLRMGMAADRGVPIKRRILAKLMLLEYLRPDQFRHLGRWQASQNGQPVELERISATADAKAGGSAEDPAIAAWRGDSWLRTWVAADPPLVGIDLRPYFYVARESLKTIIVPGLRLSALAERTLGQLLSTTKAERAKALKGAPELPEHDVRAVFLAVTERCRRTEKLDLAGSPLEVAIQLAEVRPELLSDLFQVLTSLPHSSLGGGVPPQVKAISKVHSDRAAEVTAVLEGWSSSTTNAALAAAAKAMLTR